MFLHSPSLGKSGRVDEPEGFCSTLGQGPLRSLRLFFSSGRCSCIDSSARQRNTEARHSHAFVKCRSCGCLWKGSLRQARRGISFFRGNDSKRNQPPTRFVLLSFSLVIAIAIPFLLCHSPMITFRYPSNPGDIPLSPCYYTIITPFLAPCYYPIFIPLLSYCYYHIMSYFSCLLSQYSIMLSHHYLIVLIPLLLSHDSIILSHSPVIPWLLLRLLAAAPSFERHTLHGQVDPGGQDLRARPPARPTWTFLKRSSSTQRWRSGGKLLSYGYGSKSLIP